MLFSGTIGMAMKLNTLLSSKTSPGIKSLNKRDSNISLSLSILPSN